MEISYPVLLDLSRAFRLEPVPGQIFRSEACLSVFQLLSDVLAAKVSTMVLLAGSPGVGKTNVVRSFAKLYNREGGAQPASLLCQATQDQGFAAIHIMLADQVRPRMLIVDDAATLSEKQKKLVLRIAEAGLLSPEPTSVVLVGDSNLRTSFKEWEGTGRPQLVWREVLLAPLKIDEVGRYLRHRLVAAGCLGPGDQVPFDAEAVELLFELAQGVPRFIDHFAERALYEASKDGSAVVDGDLVRASLLDGSPLEIGWPPAPVSIWRTPPASATPAKSSPADAPPAKLQVVPDPLRANPGMAILPTPRRRGRSAALVLSLALIAGLAGTVVFMTNSFPRRLALSEATPSVLQEVGLLPHIADDTARVPAGLAKTPSALGLGPPLNVSIDPDPADLLEQGLQAGMTKPADAALAYEQAALWGNGRAAYFMGQLFETGLGVPVDLHRAQAWYSVAVAVPGAEARLAELAKLPVAGDGVTTAPLPLQHVLFRSGRMVLRWRSVSGQGPQRYIVEYVLAGEGNQVRQAQTTLSAMLVERPLIRWRVISVDDQGRHSGTSAWSKAIPPAR